MTLDSLDELQKKIKMQNDIIKGYEKVLKLNEEELANSDEIIRMYEQIIDYSGLELKNAQQTVEANQIVSTLSRDELIQALGKIKNLEDANRKLREEALKFGRD